MSMHGVTLAVAGANERTVQFVRSVGATRIAEIGIYEGATSRELARVLGGRGSLHLFDYADRVEATITALRAAGHANVIGYGNTDLTYDSYVWSLMRLAEQHPEPIWDYVYLDGSHYWHMDALAFCLVDKLLAVGGHIEFDDYAWSLAKSPSMNPLVRPETAAEFTPEQIEAQHVKLIVELLVRRCPRYVEVVPDRVFRKLAHDGGRVSEWDRQISRLAGMARWALARLRR